MDELEIRNKWEVWEGSDNIFKKKYNQQYIWNDEKSIKNEWKFKTLLDNWVERQTGRRDV